MGIERKLIEINNRLKRGEGWIGYRCSTNSDGEKVRSKFIYYAFYQGSKQKFVNTKSNDPEQAYRELHGKLRIANLTLRIWALPNSGPGAVPRFRRNGERRTASVPIRPHGVVMRKTRMRNGATPRRTRRSSTRQKGSVPAADTKKKDLSIPIFPFDFATAQPN